MTDKTPWFERVAARRARGEKARAFAAQHALFDLTESVTRAFYEEQWAERVVNWEKVAELLDKAVAGGWPPAL